MKSITPLLLTFLLFVGCSTDDELEFTNDITCPQEETCRTMAEAISIAEKAPNDFAIKVSRATTTNKKVDYSNIEIIKNRQSRSTSNGLDTLMYIIPYSENDGFAVVSANPATEGLIAYVEHGSYEDGEKIENFNSYMNSAINYIIDGNYDRPIKRPGFKQYRTTRDTIDIATVLPKLEVAWGQFDIEGSLAKNRIAGCSNVAMAQIMSYFEQPKSMSVTFKDAPCTNIQINWSDIKAHKFRHNLQKFLNYTCTSSSEEHNNLSILMRQLGELNNSDYITTPDKETTNTYTSDVIEAFNNLGYTATSKKRYSGENFYNDLSNNKLIVLRGEENSSSIGHDFVIDGTVNYTVLKREWEAPYGSDIWTIINEVSRADYSYLHINWGFHGSCNGYFSKGVFYTQNAHSYDYPSYPGYQYTIHNFINDLKYFTVTY